MQEPVDALVGAAPDGIDFDGLVVAERGDGYAFRTSETEHAGLAERDLRDVAAGSPYVTNWHFWHAVAPQSGDRWAFLRWLEDAEERGVAERHETLRDGGATAEWGEVHLLATLDESGSRRYRVRHVEDADAAADDLDTHADPLDAREVAKRDDDGRYRPLKTAPTLRTGWEFADLTATELLETLDFLYPASVANWHREREGDLDVTHWRETAARQTGIYGVVETWDRNEGHDHVNRLAETCCEDSQCIKRREWGYDAETDLDVDGGDGTFPCREPCSLAISAARRFVRLDGEDEQEYTVTLTESEAEQLAAIVDAVAEGRAGDVREADLKDPANRYRARYLRAKRFADGELLQD